MPIVEQFALRPRRPVRKAAPQAFGKIVERLGLLRGQHLRARNARHPRLQPLAPELHRSQGALALPQAELVDWLAAQAPGEAATA